MFHSDEVRFILQRSSIDVTPNIPSYRNPDGISPSPTPAISRLASQSLLCFPSSLVSALVLAISLPFR